MSLRCYAGHLNLSRAQGGGGGDAPPLAPPLAFLGAHSGEPQRLQLRCFGLLWTCCRCLGWRAAVGAGPSLAARHLCSTPTPLQLATQTTIISLPWALPPAELLVSPSDDGNLFLWDYASGHLVAVLPPTVTSAAAPTLSAADGGSAELSLPAVGATCVAPHPFLPVLAAGGADAVVRLWSPEAEAAGSLQLAAEAAEANLQCLAEGGMAPAGDGLGMLLGGGGSAGSGGVPHCHTM